MSDNFFQDEGVQEVLFERAKSPENSVWVGGETIDGVHKRYSSEYRRWNFWKIINEVSVHVSEEQYKQWFIDNPPPANKFEEN